MNEIDWERWFETFDGFDEKLKDRAESMGSDVLETLTRISDGCEDPVLKRDFDRLERQIEDALELHRELEEKSKAAISDMDDELELIKPIAAERLAQQFALPLQTVQHKAIMEWCEENLQSYYWWLHRTRQTRVLVITEDNEKVMFKLRWADTIPDLMP